MKNALILLFVCFIQHMHANEYALNESALHTDARDLSLGGLICDYQSVENNELALTCLIPFQLKDLSVRKVAYAKKAFALEWQLDWYQSGNVDWMENNVGLHVGKNLNEQLYLGVSASLLKVENAEESVTTCFAELDGHYRLSEKIMVGIRMINPVGARIYYAGVTIPLSSSAHLGAQLSPTSKSRIFIELHGQLHQPLRGRTGLEYALYDSFILRTGLSTNPLMPSWGIGGTINRFKYSWGGNLHPILGFSNGFTLTYCW